MGLEERRKIQELREVTLPARTREIEQICGVAIPYQVDWESFDTLEALNFLDNISCHRLGMALHAICSDDLGRRAVSERLKLVRLHNSHDKTVALAFTDGVLDMTNDYAQHEYASDGAICALLTDKL